MLNINLISKRLTFLLFRPSEYEFYIFSLRNEVKLKNLIK